MLTRMLSHSMSTQLKKFSIRFPTNLRVFRPDRAVVTTYEDHIPNGPIHTIYPDMRPDHPKVSWIKPGYEYFAYLPKDRIFDGHLLAPLKHHTPNLIERDGRWYLDDATCKLWVALDHKFTKSILVVGSGMVVELEDHEPPSPAKYGFTQGHKSMAGLSLCLKITKYAFVHRLAYLTYLIAIGYMWDKELCEQLWWRNLVVRCDRHWADSVWDAVYRRWSSRNFVGVAVKPQSGITLKWLRTAYEFGVPIWVLFSGPTAYNTFQDASVLNIWLPTAQQVSETTLMMTKVPPQHPQPTIPLTPDPQTNLPAQPTFPSPPAVIPKDTQWYESWQDFFCKRDESYKKQLGEATDDDKRAWKAQEDNAKGFHPPGRSGPRVYVWEECDSGGFLQTLQTRHDAMQGWDNYPKETLVFFPVHNTWDHCPFIWKPAVESGPPDDTDTDDEDPIMEHWYIKPDLPPTLPDANPSPLDFLYHRYGFIQIEPTIPPQVILPLGTSDTYRIVGLEAEGAQPIPHLPSFITSILQRQLPSGHCDLSPESPPNEVFPASGTSFIDNNVFHSLLPQLTEETVFIVQNTDYTRLLVVHEPLSLLQMVRAGTPPNLNAQLQYLLYNGSQFTLLHSYHRVSPSFIPLAFPVRERDWRANADDYQVYMSRLKTFLLERPYVTAAAFSRGGIAWRIAREVLGIEESLEAVLKSCPSERNSVKMSQREYWFQEVKEEEWFYLVGGYEESTGL